MKITFLGGADEVGASCSIVDMGGKRLLIDAGIRISPKSSRGVQNSQLPDLQLLSAAGGPDYILVTHAHTDHTGALPLVTEQYPNTPVIMTAPSMALTQTLQKDAQRIMRSNYEAEGELPLFDQVAVDSLFSSIQMVDFNQPLKLGENLQVTYYISGHIAGAGLLVLESPEGTLVMSGDVSLSEQRTVRSLDIPRIRADALVLESTYGGRLHAERRGEELRLIETLMRVVERGGKVLIPAFALGRAQEVIQIILAYRDKLDVPVYVDGMVRSVCDTYARFRDLLPPKMVKAAGDDHLFFREKVKPITSRNQREQVAMSDTPLVVVASSGMLTGGASVFYAKHFATDERNAIFLTGYQDEESPGRFLQRIMREKQEGEIPTLRLDNDIVKVRCEIGTYSLSAHADEQELVNVAKALKAKEVMLVHGDHGARHSLATALRRRQIVVTTPRIGTVREFKFKKKPWAVGAQVESGSETGAVDVEKLWANLSSRAGDYFSARELAQVWWGDGERTDDMVESLDSPDNIFFSADWREKTTYRVQSEKQVSRMKYRRQIMLRYPDLVGKLIVMRNSNNQPRLGVVTDGDIDSFDAIVQGAKGSHFPADALLWVIGDWQGFTKEGEESDVKPLAEDDEEEEETEEKKEKRNRGTKAQLYDLLTVAKAHTDNLLPFQARKLLVKDEAAVNPKDIMPEELPVGVDEQVALVAIVLGLASDGADLVIKDNESGLKPKRALEHGPMEQNEAREMALQAFPPEARLRKVGMELHRKRLTLSFDFPQSAERRYANVIENIIEQTGWDVQVKPQVNQQALSIALGEILPEGAMISKGPSYHMEKREVHARIEGVKDEITLKREFLDITDFKLVLDKADASQAPTQTAIPEGRQQMEINAAYGLIRSQLNQYGLYKTSLKQGQIILSFISPQVGERYTEKINELSQQTGYVLGVHPHPNQQKILLVARQIFNEAGWNLRKGPGVHVDTAQISVTVHEQPSDDALQTVNDKLQEQTGYTLDISVLQAE